jgi:hypothetical protein
LTVSNKSKTDQCAHVREGSDSEVELADADFRFTTESGLKSDIAACPKSASSGLMHRSKGNQAEVSDCVTIRHPGRGKSAGRFCNRSTVDHGDEAIEKPRVHKQYISSKRSIIYILLSFEILHNVATPTAGEECEYDSIFCSRGLQLTGGCSNS